MGTYPGQYTHADTITKEYHSYMYMKNKESLWTTYTVHVTTTPLGDQGSLADPTSNRFSTKKQGRGRRGVGTSRTCAKIPKVHVSS